MIWFETSDIFYIILKSFINQGLYTITFQKLIESDYFNDMTSRNERADFILKCLSLGVVPETKLLKVYYRFTTLINNQKTHINFEIEAT